MGLVLTPPYVSKTPPITPLNWNFNPGTPTTVTGNKFLLNNFVPSAPVIARTENMEFVEIHLIDSTGKAWTAVDGVTVTEYDPLRYDVIYGEPRVVDNDTATKAVYTDLWNRLNFVNGLEFTLPQTITLSQIKIFTSIIADRNPAVMDVYYYDSANNKYVDAGYVEFPNYTASTWQTADIKAIGDSTSASIVQARSNPSTTRISTRGGYILGDSASFNYFLPPPPVGYRKVAVEVHARYINSYAYLALTLPGLNVIQYRNTGEIYDASISGNTPAATNIPFSTGDYIMFLIDRDNAIITLVKNGVEIYKTSSITTTYNGTPIDINSLELTMSYSPRFNLSCVFEFNGGRWEFINPLPAGWAGWPVT